MKLVFLGPPGAGKGTQAALVAGELNVKHISTGDMFRRAIREGTPTGIKAKAYLDAGALVPDEVTVEMVKERLAEPDCKNGYLLDGFPRSIVQAEALGKIEAPDAVVEIDVADEKLIARLSGRRVCAKCGGTYHISNLADAKVCPDCGGELTQRADDCPETIASRLRVYHEQTSPLTEYYEREGLLKRVCGDQSPEAVKAQILKALSCGA